MEKIDYHNCDLFKKIQKNVQENKKPMKELLEFILKIKIKDIEFSGTEYFDSIIEYEFSLFKIKIIDNENQVSEVYLKMTRGGKIKETIFCYWSWIYENYYKNSENKIGVIPKKAIISQTSTSVNGSKIYLILNTNMNYYAEIYLTKLKKLVENKTNLERWVNNLEIHDEDILFIGIKRY